MYTYQPIKAAYIRNFRNLGEIAIDFTKSPIITLIGDNEAGKTSVIKALTTVATNANPREQISYIRDTTNQFDLAIVLQDNTTIIRSKSKIKNEYTIKYPNGEVKQYSKLEGLPVEVQNVIGIVEEPETKELLQIRTYEDKLLFVVTPASTNYKVMYDALKVDQLTKAIKVGNKEVNGLRNEIAVSEVSMATLQNSHKNTRVFDLEPLLNIRQRVLNQKNDLAKIKKAKDEKDKAELVSKQLGVLNLIIENNLEQVDVSLIEKVIKTVDTKNKLELAIKYINNLENTERNNLEQVNISSFERLNKIYNLKKEVDLDNKSFEVLNKINAIESVNEALVYKLINLVNNLKGLNEVNKSVESLKDLDGYESINIDSYNRLTKAIYEKERLKQTEEVIELYDTELNVISDKDIQILNSSMHALESIKQINEFESIENTEITEIEKYNKLLKESGAIVSECPNCGEMVVFDISNL